MNINIRNKSWIKWPLLAGVIVFALVNVGARGCTNWNTDNSTVTGSSAAVAAPSGLTASTISSTQVTLNWTDNANNETGFKVERKMGTGGAYAQITATATASVISYNDTTVTPGNTYYYRVRSYNNWGNSDYSNEAGTLTYGNWTTTSTGANVPVSRTGQTTVWTGTQMIVWGGLDGTNTLNTGAVYSPTADTWTAITTTGAPASRTAHSAVWTGSKMIVWGGYTVATAGTNMIDNCDVTWTGATNVTPGTNAVDKLEGAAAVSLTIAAPFTTGAIAWHNLASPLNISARTKVAFWIKASNNVPSGNLSFLLASNANCTTPVETLAINSTLNTGAWTLVTLNFANPALLTSVMSVGLMANNTPGPITLLIDDIEASGGGTTYFNNGGIYDPVVDSWTNLSINNVPTVRAYHSAVWTGSYMIIWGGAGASSYNNGGVYDPATDQWKTTNFTNLISAAHPNNPSTRSQHLAFWTGVGTDTWRSKMIVWGGNGGGNTGGIYDPALDTWRTMNTTNAPSSRWGFSYVWTGAGSETWRNKIIVWGGYNGIQPLGDGASYDPFSDTWTTLVTSNAPAARMYHSAVWTGTKMIIWGGDGIIQQGGVYNPATGAWSNTAVTATTTPTARLYHSAAWDDANKWMIIWGGWNGVTYFYSGGRYNAD